MNLNPVAKAIAGGVVAALAVLYTLTGVAHATVGVHEWIAVALSFISGSGLVYVVPNSPKPPAPPAP